MVLFGQSGGLYNHYFNTFLNPIDLLWSFLQAVLMALTILLIHTYLRLFRLGRTVRCRRRDGQRGAHLADRRRVGDAAGLAVHLRLQRQLQPVGLGKDGETTVTATWQPVIVETTSAADLSRLTRPPLGAQSYARPLAGLATVVVIGIVAVAVGLFQGSFTETVPVTVLSPRAGLVMNPDAKVKMRGVQVGKVASIESRPTAKPPCTWRWTRRRCT